MISLTQRDTHFILENNDVIRNMVNSSAVSRLEVSFNKLRMNTDLMDTLNKLAIWILAAQIVFVIVPVAVLVRSGCSQPFQTRAEPVLSSMYCRLKPKSTKSIARSCLFRCL
jgi:hypothetical protein